MSPKMKVQIAAYGLIAVGLIHLAVYIFYHRGSRVPLESGKAVVQFTMAVFLLRRANWARWIVGIPAAIGTVFSAVMFAGLATGSIGVIGEDRVIPAALFYTGLAFIVFSGWVAFTLLLDRGVIRYFVPPHNQDAETS